MRHGSSAVVYHANKYIKLCGFSGGVFLRVLLSIWSGDIINIPMEDIVPVLPGVIHGIIGRKYFLDVRIVMLYTRGHELTQTPVSRGIYSAVLSLFLVFPQLYHLRLAHR